MAGELPVVSAPRAAGPKPPVGATPLLPCRLHRHPAPLCPSLPRHQVNISPPMKSLYPHLAGHNLLISQVTISPPVSSLSPNLSGHYLPTYQVTISPPVSSLSPYLSGHYFPTCQINISPPSRSLSPHLSGHYLPTCQVTISKTSLSSHLSGNILHHSGTDQLLAVLYLLITYLQCLPTDHLLAMSYLLITYLQDYIY